MLKRGYFWGLCLLVMAGGGLVFGPRPSHGASFATAPDVAWAQPGVKAVNNTGPVTLTSDERSYDCTPLTYRLIDDRSKTMRPGCFVPTAFGMMDPGQSVAIFNGTDEAEPVRYGGQPAALQPLPYSAAVARFGGFPGLGSYMYLYTDFPNSLDTEGTILYGRYKEITALPSFTVPDPHGQPLAVNPSAMGFAARGQWMVTESPAHSLIRVNLATFSVLPFDKSYYSAGSPLANHQASLAVTEDGRYTAAVSNEYGSFKVYDLKTCGVTQPDDPLAPQACQAHDYWSYIKSQVTGSLQSISHVNFVNDNLISFDVDNGHDTESYLLSPDGPITSLIPYLGLGDSYASGQGAFNYQAGTDTASNACHLSVHSYPLLLNQDIFGSRGHSVACSGAVMHDVGSTSENYTGQSSDQRSAKTREADGSETTILHDFSPGYLAQQRFVTSYQPGVITVEVGGNDVGFGDIMLRCVAPMTAPKSSAINPNNCYQSYEDRLEIVQTVNRNYDQWVQLFKQLQAQSPLSRVYAVGYPQIVSPAADCRLNVLLTMSEISFARDLTNYLNATIQKAARAGGVQYIDISNALNGRELCSGASGDLAVNGLTAGTDTLGVFGQESFHPTAIGHQLIEEAILAATHNFATSPKPAANPSEPAPLTDDTLPILQAPKTGRSITAVTPSSQLVIGGMGRPGGSLTITAIGLQPNTSYSVHLGDVAVGSVTTDGSGNLQGTVTLPGGGAGGTQPVSVTGPGQSGDPVTIVQVIYVDTSPTDYDGDGIPNSQDSCPLVINSGVDVDHDSLDDACDSSITSPLTTNSSPTNPPSAAVPPQTALQSTANPQLSLQAARITQDIFTVARPSGAILRGPVTKASKTGVLGVSVSIIHTPQPPTMPQVLQSLPDFLWYIWLALMVMLGGVGYIARRPPFR